MTESHASTLTHDRPAHRGTSLAITVLEIALIFCVFWIHAGWPVPDDNEAHYLGKAKHYWNEQYVATDFFYETADAHVLFYWTFGWLSLLMPLPMVAWVGRFITWGLLAFGWQRLSHALLPHRGAAVLTSALFVCFNEQAHMAGEWVVGGVEAKGLAYGLVFLGLASMLHGRWNLAWLLLGAASAFHVIVGGWTVLVLALAWLCVRERRPSLLSMAPGLAGGFAIALLGLVPALALTLDVPKDIVAQGNLIYVYERLPHHLVPQTFRPGFIGRHLLLIAVWALLCTFVPAEASVRRLRWCVAGAIGLAAIGYLLSSLGEWLGRPAWMAGLLRYYWFRMSDAFVPMGVALELGRWLGWLRQTRHVAFARWLAGTALIGFVYLALRGQDTLLAEAPRVDRNVVLADWLDACRWARENTPPDAVFITPRLAATFQWYAERGAVADWKNVPQNSDGIVEWWTRINDLHAERPATPDDRWVDSPAEHGEDELRRLADKYGATHAVLPKLEEEVDVSGLPVVYENASYRIVAFARPP